MLGDPWAGFSEWQEIFRGVFRVASDSSRRFLGIEWFFDGVFSAASKFPRGLLSDM